MGLALQRGALGRRRQHGGDVVVAGYRPVDGIASRCLSKLDVFAGAEAWAFSDFGDAASSYGAFELITLVDDADVLLSGFAERTSDEEMSFKSYGNILGGAKAVVIKMPIAALTGATAPTVADMAWTVTWDSHVTAKGAISLPDGDVIVKLYAENPEARMAALTRLDGTTGTAMWGPHDYGDIDGGFEGTSLAVQTSGGSTAVALAGHGPGIIARRDGRSGPRGKTYAHRRGDGRAGLDDGVHDGWHRGAHLQRVLGRRLPRRRLRRGMRGRHRDVRWRWRVPHRRVRCRPR